MNINELPIYNTPYGKFVLDPKDGVCNHIARGEFWDIWIKQYLESLNKDSICLDIGSHIGFLTVYMAKNCKHVYSFEPQKINYDRLVKNVELNGLTNVTCYNVALHDKPAKMNINNIKKQSEVNYDNYQACSLSLFEDLEGDVEAKTLDCFNLSNVSFIKSDCEGNDINVLKGGIETITKYRPKIIFEHGGEKGDFAAFFQELNYDVLEVAGQNFLATPK